MSNIDLNVNQIYVYKSTVFTTLKVYSFYLIRAAITLYFASTLKLLKANVQNCKRNCFKIFPLKSVKGRTLKVK